MDIWERRKKIHELIQQDRSEVYNNAEYDKWDVVGRGKVIFTPTMARRYRCKIHQYSEASLYAEQMLNKTWVGIFPLRFNRSGVIFAGGTRMTAVVMAGVPVEFDVEIIQEVIIDDRGREIHHLCTMTEDEVLKVFELK